VLSIPVGDLFKAAIIPGLALVGLYLIYVLTITHFNKASAPPIPDLESNNKTELIKNALINIIPPLTMH